MPKSKGQPKRNSKRKGESSSQEKKVDVAALADEVGVSIAAVLETMQEEPPKKRVRKQKKAAASSEAAASAAAADVEVEAPVVVAAAAEAAAAEAVVAADGSDDNKPNADDDDGGGDAEPVADQKEMAAAIQDAFNDVSEANADVKESPAAAAAQEEEPTTEKKKKKARGTQASRATKAINDELLARTKKSRKPITTLFRIKGAYTDNYPWMAFTSQAREALAEAVESFGDELMKAAGACRKSAKSETLTPAHLMSAVQMVAPNESDLKQLFVLPQKDAKYAGAERKQHEKKVVAAWKYHQKSHEKDADSNETKSVSLGAFFKCCLERANFKQTEARNDFNLSVAELALKVAKSKQGSDSTSSAAAASAMGDD